ncbi:DoxX family protein [Acinetobacter rathckeae]|uniref:DoxX family protein n=1 Tax=Acinetobacter rathckeae TaxID=2605272 RepID=UPI0018A29AB3|nr:DoxX family protein [Acinetobacter rathckeae]MBF7687359.1 DoxX family protein [Acinetobacter rathckeae]MBF7694760.1 DoxX family protein [Acinetobacter rathckeae]
MNTLRYFELGTLKSAVLLLARILLAFLFIKFGIPKLLGFSGTIGYMTALHLPLPAVTAAVVVLIEVVFAGLLVLGFYTRPLALILALYTLGTAIIGHPYWSLTGDSVMPNAINFYKNISIVGGFLLLMITGPGAISLDKR